MAIDINKHEVDIENLFKQNELDLCSIKELYRKLKELEKKISQIKYIDSNLADKLKKDYESLKRIILDENIQLQLDNRIDELNTKINNSINEINEQLDTVIQDIDKMIINDCVNVISLGVPITGNGYANDKINEIIGLIQSGLIVNKTLDFKGYTVDLNGLITVPWGVNVINARFNVYHSDNSALKFQGRHIVDNISFNYPEQDMGGNNIIKYPSAIVCSSSIGYSSFSNINLGNAYKGIDLSNGVSGGTIIYNVWGYPLYRGIIINNCIDVVNIDRVHFNPNYYGVPNVILKTWVWQNAIAVECGRYDFGNVNRVFAWGYYSPFKVTNGTRGGACNNVKFTNWIADACQKFCVFEYHDGGLLFQNGTGTFYNPYEKEQKEAGMEIPSISNTVGIIQGGGSSTWGGKFVYFINNRIYRCQNHGIFAKNPIICIGNEIINYAHGYEESASSVIDAVQLQEGSDNSIVANNLFDGKNKAQNRCIAIVGSLNHKISNNQYLGWKAADIYGYKNTGTVIDGVIICDSLNRPSGYMRVGVKIFDTTLNKELTWNGSNWVQFDGSVVA